MRINFKQEELIKNLMKSVRRKFPEVELINVSQSPEDSESLWIQVTQPKMGTERLNYGHLPVTGQRTFSLITGIICWSCRHAKKRKIKLRENREMELTKENCLKMKEEQREYLKGLSIDEKIKRVEELRSRVEIIREIRRKRNENLQVTEQK